MQRPVTRSYLQAALACVLLAGCSEEDPPVVIEITVGWEKLAFQDAPAVLTLDVAAIDPGEAVIATATTTPGGSFSLGEVPPDQLLRIEAHGRDAAGIERMKAKSLVALAGGIESDLWPVFIQRTGAFARPPGELLHGHVNGVGGVLGERFLFVTGGTGIPGSEPGEPGTIAYYDMLALSSTAGARVDNIAPRSLVVSADGSAILLIDDQRAVWVDFDVGVQEVELPAGLTSFADVAGGMTVDGPEASFVVGATRLEAPSDRVLVVFPDRSIGVATLPAPRTGAAATWIENAGLAIAGGNDTVDGVDLLRIDAQQAQPIGFVADPVVGAGATAGEGAGELVLVCGRDGAEMPAPARLLNLSCTQCEPTMLDFALPEALDRCSVYNGPNGFIVVGADGTGEMRAFLINSVPEVSEIALRDRRRGAVVAPAPNGTLAVIGGEKLDGTPALTIESLMP